MVLTIFLFRCSLFYVIFHIFVYFLVYFVKQQTQLEELSLRKLFFNSTVHRRNLKMQSKLAQALSHFLSTQTHLTRLDLSQISWSVDMGMEVLTSVTSNAGSNPLTHLFLRDYFMNGLNAANQQLLMQSLRMFTHLQELSINYNCLSDDVIDLISKTCGATLQHFDVWAYKFDAQLQTIDDFQWKLFHDRAPAVQSSWHLESIQEFRSVQSVMQRHLPNVTSFEFWNCSQPLGEHIVVKGCVNAK